MKVTLIKTWNIANNLHIWGISRVELVLWGDEAIAHSVKNKISWMMSIKRFSKFFLTLYLETFLCQCVHWTTHNSQNFRKIQASSSELPCHCSIFIIYLSNKQFPTKFEILFVSSIPRLHAIISLRKMQHRAATTVPVLVHIFPN